MAALTTAALTTAVYSGTERLTDGAFGGFVVAFFTEGTGQHDYLLLEQGGRFFKLDWGPAAGAKKAGVSDVPGAVRYVQVKSNAGCMKLGDARLSCEDIKRLADSMYGRRSYNTHCNNCIGFCDAVCKAIGVKFACDALSG